MIKKNLKFFLIILILFSIAFNLVKIKVVNATGLNDYITDIVFYTDAQGYVRARFKVNQSFTIEYTTGIDGCTTKNWSWWEVRYAIGSNKFNTGILWDGSVEYAFFIQSLDINKASSCDNIVEQYIAGNTYDVYLYRNYPSNSLFILNSDGFEAGNPNSVIKDSPTCQRSFNCPYNNNDYIKFRWNSTYFSDVFYWNGIVGEKKIKIDYPENNSEVNSTFNLQVEYKEASGYNRVLFLFEQWNASSTCPEYGSPEWEQEYNNYFIYQSEPFLSPRFNNESGTTTIEVKNLPVGTYNCIRCYLINEDTGTGSENFCQDYKLQVIKYIQPEQIPQYILPIPQWSDFYASNTQQFETSTPLFSRLADFIEPFFTKIGNLLLPFQNIFEPSKAIEMGTKFGNAIPVLRGYLAIINNFFGELPISEIFIVYLITAIVVIILKIILKLKP